MKKGALLYTVFIFLSLQIPAQTAALDSLKAAFADSNADTNAVNLLNELILEYGNIDDLGSSLIYFHKAINLGNKLSFKSGLAKSYRYIAGNYTEKGEFSSALDNLTQAEKLFTELRDAKNIARVNNSKGNIMREMGKYPEAQKYYFSAIRQFERMNDTMNVIISKTNLASIYRTLKNYAECVIIYKESLKFFLEKNDPYAGFVYNNMGNLYSELKDFEESIRCFSEALKIFEQSGSKLGQSIACNNIGAVWQTLGDLDKALKNFSSSLALREEIKDKKGIANTSTNIGSILTQMKKLREAESFFRRSLQLSIEVGSAELLANVYHGLSVRDSVAGDFRSALANYKKYVVYRDSLVNEEVTRSSIQQQMQYEFDKKETENKMSQAKKDAVAAEEKRRQDILLWSVISGLTLVVIFAVLIFRAFRLKAKANKKILLQKQIIEVKQQEILDSIIYARRIQQALMTPEKYIQRVLNRLRKK